jgi:hypothetical protein
MDEDKRSERNILYPKLHDNISVPRRGNRMLKNNYETAYRRRL